LLEPGQVFASRYRVQRCIAEGGMGAIFEAEHTGTERRVALKLLFPHIVSVASAREKFELEAKISARVNSPFIVQVLDAGYDEASKYPYLVMELLAGQTLAARVRERGPFAVDEALRVLGQVAAGLDAAHGYREPSGAPKPIVHRDLKPENLFLAREHDGAIVAKILDYGIAKMLGDTGNLSQEVRGTPLYMAYEQVTAEALSPQTDVWAYGLIAHYMLTGAHYWRASHRPDTNIQALFAEILSLPLEAPSLRLREHGVAAELPPGFDGWLLQCIDRTPARRFASAGAALDALGRIYERGMRARSKPAPAAPAPLPALTDRTRTFVEAPPAKSPTVGSFAGLASETGSGPPRAPPFLSL
jgi:serine/threonine protein kinase